jgi:two-component system NtrC family sensor kinase
MRCFFYTGTENRGVWRTSYMALLCIVFCLPAMLYAQSGSVIQKADQPISIGANTSILIDSNNRYTPATITSATAFTASQNSIPIFPVEKGTIWVKFSLVNQSVDSVLYIDLQYANISHIAFYQLQAQQLSLLRQGGNAYVFDETKQVSPFYICRIGIPKGDSATYFLQIRSKHQVLLPIFIENRNSVDASTSLQEMVIGLYMGIMLAIFLYNLFLYFSTRDTSYLVYVMYLFFLAIAQITVAGYGFKYFWSNYPAVNDYALPITSAMAGISGITFAIFFLRTKFYTPKLNPVLFLLIAFYVAAIVLCIMDLNSVSYNILNFISLAGGLILLSASWYIARKNRYKPAYFYFVAWIAFLAGMIIFVYYAT